MPGMSPNLRRALLNRHTPKKTDILMRLVVLFMLSMGVYLAIIISNLNNGV
jgi:hypothetical protein